MFVFVNNHIKSWKKINICVSLSPSLIWKPKTNIEIRKSPNASFPINYQWLHLAGWAAEGSNVRPGYFRAPSSEPWAQAVWNLSMCCALPYLEAAAAQQLFLPSIPALMQCIWLWHYTGYHYKAGKRKQDDGRKCELNRFVALAELLCWFYIKE